MEDTMNHYGTWIAVLVWIILYAVLILFLPFYKKCGNKPKGTYIAFVVAFALEMFGIPFSMYAIGWIFGITLPEGVFWGHTLVSYIGLWGMYIGIICMLIGLFAILSGWKQIYKAYWSKEKGYGALVTTGIYARIRHPQYTGLFLITLGMLLEWATIPLLIMWPIIVHMYWRLAKKEEQDMLQEFGEEYGRYMDQTGRFLPKF